jgi:hypothetical protein
MTLTTSENSSAPSQFLPKRLSVYNRSAPLREERRNRRTISDGWFLGQSRCAEGRL